MTRARTAFLAAGLLVGAILTAAADEGSGDREPSRERPPSVPPDPVLVAMGAVVGEIRIEAQDIFDTSDPAEDVWVFRWANRIHPKTKERVIRHLLLFRSGDPYDPGRLRESERILRRVGYLYDAWIRPVAVDGRRVDVEVVTRDVWTLSLGVGFGRSGGKNRTRIGVEDSNFLGTGKEVTVRRTSDVDRTQFLYRYRDKNLAGTRGTLQLAVADNSDGKLSSLDVGRPFYSLDARWSFGVSLLSDDREDTLYEAGEEVDRFRHRVDRAEAWAGFSRGRSSGRTVRWSAGFAWDRDRFDASVRVPPTGPLPADRELAYPWIGVSRIEDAFITTRDLDRIVRTEDLNLGLEAAARLGWSSSSFGGDRGRMLYEASARRGRRLGDAGLLFLGAQGSGRWSSGGAENVLAGGWLRYYRRNLGGHAFFLAARLDGANRLDREDQLLIGGDTGLRGYPLRFQSGNRRALLTLEQRFYTDWDVARLFHVGAAVFLDVGRAWFTGPRTEPRPWLRDVGFGLRIGSSRSSQGAMVHVDLAVALDAGDGVRRTQFLVETRETF